MSLEIVSRPTAEINVRATRTRSHFFLNATLPPYAHPLLRHMAHHPPLVLLALERRPLFQGVDGRAKIPLMRELGNERVRVEGVLI